MSFEQCQYCDYDLRGLPSQDLARRCPECGRVNPDAWFDLVRIKRQLMQSAVAWSIGPLLIVAAFEILGHSPGYPNLIPGLLTAAGVLGGLTGGPLFAMRFEWPDWVRFSRTKKVLRAAAFMILLAFFLGSTGAAFGYVLHRMWS